MSDTGSPERTREVLVVCAGLSAVPQRPELLADTERERAAALPPIRAREYRAGRALLRWALGRSLGEYALQYRIGTTGRGRPVVREAPDIGVSISHGGGVVAVAVARGRNVGVDTEQPVPPRPGLVRRCCSPAQRQELAAEPSGRQASLLARCWTVHEARAKAAGTGLPRRFPVLPGPLRADGGVAGGIGWRVLPSFAGAAVTVAFGAPWHRPRLRLAVLGCASRPLNDSTEFDED
ncbi:4'-phosphopantetheinyl transferase family protein [Streptomyces albidus (ex Kaewkla and Franco 2022)]|uniref:4'-phosphopantetheinyl transferase family protein n=1 Tax=Streptomyces albidus (ex Kaewkla and Franco 2022) TaxID=722709 RepID=UPI0015EF0B5D|nr:4'-phosphopantetheinyl transferase superfamily protein [Streptomyces albidus (ex Kaewkla and Franco 2022)]